MKSAKLVLFFLIAVCFSAFGQDDDGKIILKDSSYLKSKDYMKQYEYENFQNSFKPKKKNTWAIGIHAGPSWISGDVNPQIQYGLGFNIEKALGHLVSLRAQGIYSQNKGLDWENNHNHLSYQTSITDFNIQAVLNLGNINFYKRQPSLVFYLFGGIGLATSKTKGDVLDANGVPYNFSGITEANSGCIFCGSDEVGRKDVKNELKELMDGEYETTEMRANTDLSAFNGRIIHPSLISGAGLRYRISDKMDLHFEHRFSFHSDDLLDGTNKQTSFGTISQGTDIWQYTNIGISWKIGNRAESLYWSNPLYTPLDDIRALKEQLDEGNFFKDEDEDGVLDQFDLESNTPPRAAVNTKGVALDSDNDGIPDYLDKELFTPSGSPIDGNGVALDSDFDGVEDIFDMESNTAPDAFVDIHGRAIDVSAGRGGEFGIVYFDLNSSRIKKDFYPVIHDVASYIEQNPSAKIEVSGHTDTRGSEQSNIRLGQKRAEGVIKILKSQFGIPDNRIVVATYGESRAMVPNLPENFDPQFEGGHYLNRRVEFKIIN